MASKTGWNLGVKYNWSDRESGWGDDMNANLLLIDTLAQMSAIDKDLTSPPSAGDGDVYLLNGGGQTGAWAGHGNAITVYDPDSGGWVFYVPRPGYLIYLEDEDKYYYYNGASWQMTSVL